MNTKHSGYAVAYAAVLGLACALALTAVDGVTASRKKANAEAEEIRNILSVLGVPFEAGAGASGLIATYELMVASEERGGLTFYVYDHPEKGRLRATRFSGQGLWGPIEGFLCLEEDMRTVYALSFYRQEETPGLGGEISSEGFLDLFRGKSIVDPLGAPGIRIVGDGADEINEVDAISGATMTSDRVEAMLNDVIDGIVEEGGFRGE